MPSRRIDLTILLIMRLELKRQKKRRLPRRLLRRPEFRKRRKRRLPRRLPRRPESRRRRRKKKRLPPRKLLMRKL